MSDLTLLTISEMNLLLMKREFSAEELVLAHLCAIKEKNQELNHFVTITENLALQRAKNADKLIKEGNVNVLTGIPIGVKDMFCTKGVLTTACSKMLNNFIPEYESTVTQKLIDAGSVMLGKLNMDEFAMGSANLYSIFGAAKNIYKKNGRDLVPGGSSGASAASVAAHLCPASLGSDTGGSVRQPAAFCGVVGVKPTYGSCSRYGMVAFASSLDQAGVFARNVCDASLVLSAIIGFDNKDSRSIKRDFTPFSLSGDIKGKRIGIPKEYRMHGTDPEILSCWDLVSSKLQKNGAEIIEVSLPYTEYALPVYYIVASAEASSNLARYDGIRYGTRFSATSISDLYETNRSNCFGDEVKRRIFIGTYVLSSGYYDAYYSKAIKVQELIREDFKNVFSKVDIILTPTTPTTAFPIDEKISPMMMYQNDIFTVPTSIAGLPAVSVPVGFSKENLPIGLQVIGNLFAEEEILNMAYAIENLQKSS